ncbi:MAG: hypothetical protein IPL32_18480 [Chloracidobacterium sp.]|nr:hypothetical protein [Chloracidobacterium sp.]
MDAKTKPRSLEQMRRFFGVLRAMYSHWPESAEFQPESEEHLRKWALIKAGHRETTDVPVAFAEDQPGLTQLTALAIEGALKAAGAYAFIRPHPDGGMVRVFKAKSIAFDKLGQADFNTLNDAVEVVYAHETGLDPETVLKAQEAAA